MTSTEPAQMSVEHLRTASENVRWANHSASQASRDAVDLTERIATARELAQRLSEHIEHLERAYRTWSEDVQAGRAAIDVDTDAWRVISDEHSWTGTAPTRAADSLRDAHVQVGSASASLDGAHYIAALIRPDAQ